MIFGKLYLLDGITPQVSFLVDMTGELLIFIMQFIANGVRLKVSVRVREPLPYSRYIYRDLHRGLFAMPSGDFNFK